MAKWTTIAERNTPFDLMASVGGERDSRGHATETPKKLCRYWCKVEQLNATEIIAFNQQYAQATLSLKTVWAPTTVPDSSMWLQCGDRRLEIVGVENVENQNREWRFLCSEQVKVKG